VNLLTAFARWIDDGPNPVTVKELRQAVRSRLVASLLVLFLLVQVATLGFYLLANENAGNTFTGGREIFLIFQGILLTTCFLFVPAYVGARTARERGEASGTDLMYITTIGPAAITRGKLASGLAITGLVYSACAPFMVLTYLMRGIDLPTILTLLGFDLLATSVAIQGAILVAVLPVNRPIKHLLSLGLALLYLFGLGMAVTISSEILQFGLGASLASWAFWGPVLFTISLWLSLAGLLFVLTLAALAPAHANRALPVRLYLTGLWAASGLLAWGLGLNLFTPGLGPDSDPVLAWTFTHLALLGCVLFGIVSERDRPGPRLLRHLPRHPVLRVPAFLFSSGNGGGLTWWLFMIGLTLLVPAFWHQRVRSIPDHERMALQVGIYLAYLLTFALAALFVRRHLLRTAPHTTVPFAFALFALASVGPSLAIFFLQPDRWYDAEKTWMLANPFGLLAYWDDLEYLARSLSLVGPAAAILFLLTLPALAKQLVTFHRPAQAAAAPAATPEPAPAQPAPEPAPNPAPEPEPRDG